METITPEISEFGWVLLFMIAAGLLILLGLFVSSLLRPANPNPEKLASYECGEEAIGNAWGQFNIKFYIIALVFLVFEVEIIFLFPWGIVFGNKELIDATQGKWATFAITEAFIFIGILIMGLVYAWKKGFLDWVRPEQKITEHKSPVPASLYEKLNQKYSTSKQPVQ